MCGIAGFIDRETGDSATGEALLDRMLKRIRHRGPDGDGVLADARHGFYAGMRRLSIIDLEGGNQPIVNEDGTVAVLFNGEIYNYIELRDKLRARGHHFRTDSDTEVLVHLYEESGADLVKRLRGMFAFVIYDSARRRLLFARDHFGQKPLYYWTSGTRFAFGSELKSLMVLPFVPRSVDSDALLDYLSWFSLPAPRTHFHGIQKLPAGSLLELDLAAPAAAKHRTYWRFESARGPLLRDMGRAAEALDAALDDSVSVHLRSDVPVGVLLSSGLDSKIVGTYAAARHPGGMSTFTAGYAGEGSEFDGARRTAEAMGSTHYEIRITAEDLASDISRVAWHLDEPVGDPAAFAVFRVCELARNHVKVLLSGEGSDELFGGYAERYEGMLATLRRSDAMRRFGAFLPKPSLPYPPDKAGRFLRRAKTSRAAEMIALRIEGLPGDVRSPRGLTPAQLARMLVSQEELGAALVRPQRDDLHTLLALDMEWQLPDSLLLKADKMSMGTSIELRTPFLDVPLASLAARIHPDLKLSGGVGKCVLRRCMARRDPDETFDRPKRGFPIPVNAWLRGPLKDRVHDDVFRTAAAWRGTLDARLITELWNDLQSGQYDNGRVFYALWLYEIWFSRMTRC